MSEDDLLPPEPADPTYVRTIMEYGLHESGKKYTAEEALELYKKGRDASLDMSESRVDELELADVAAEWDRWSIAESRIRLEKWRMTVNCPIEEARPIGLSAARNLSVHILSTYSNILDHYRSLERGAVYDLEEVSPAVRRRLVDAEAELKKAIAEFEEFYTEFQFADYAPVDDDDDYAGKSKEEIYKELYITSASQHRAEITELKKEKQDERGMREQAIRKANSGCGCLILIVPLIIGATVMGVALIT